MLKIIDFFTLHPLVYKLVRISALFFSLLMAAILYVALVGISINVSGMRDKVATMLTEKLGREVRFDGDMKLEISARPKLNVMGLHISNAAHFEGGYFASLGEAKLALDLWPLLRLRFQIEELSGSDVHIRLQLKQDGSNNWTFKSALPHPVEKQITNSDQTTSLALESVLARLDIKRVSLEKLDVEYIAANSKSHFFELQSLVAQLPAGEPIKLTLYGKIEKTHPYQLDFTGGSITELSTLDAPWPIDLKLAFLSSQLFLKGNINNNTGTFNF